MTQRQIEDAKKAIYDVLPKREPGTALVMSKEQRKTLDELSCREMINSCLCYNESFLEGRYAADYERKLGKKRVEELYNEQFKDFTENAIVHKGVYQDNEGIIYNGIVWRDDPEWKNEN